MKRMRYFLPVLALALVMTAGIGKAWAYFTTYAQAQGGILIELGSETEITEKFSSWTKHLTIANDEGSEPVYIRAKVFYGGDYTVTCEGTGWAPGADGYYYYNDIVEGGRSTEELLVKIGGIPEGEDLKDQQTINIIVIYESTPVRYDEDGDPYADWNVILDNGTTSPDTTQKEASEG